MGAAQLRVLLYSTLLLESMEIFPCSCSRRVRSYTGLDVMPKVATGLVGFATYKSNCYCLCFNFRAFCYHSRLVRQVSYINHSAGLGCNREH